MTTVAMPKPHRDRGIEGRHAKWYAANTGEMMNEFIELARRIAGQLPPGSRVLEVAPGPGYFSIELAKLGSFSVTGLDISHAMVKIATGIAAEAGVNVDFMQGSASNLPFPKDSFDFLLCRAAFKNFAQPVLALQEMCRVLKPGGKAVIIDLSRNASPSAVTRYVDGLGLSRINRMMTKLVFKFMLIKSAYTREQFEHMLAEANFSRVDILEEDLGFEITMTK
jgi:ubiquinone/menaquinone biosynthesis C-methylase UbiE